MSCFLFCCDTKCHCLDLVGSTGCARSNPLRRNSEVLPHGHFVKWMQRLKPTTKLKIAVRSTVTSFRLPDGGATCVAKQYGAIKRKRHPLVSFFLLRLQASHTLADSMRPQLNTFYLAMKTYRIRLPTNRILNSHPIF